MRDETTASISRRRFFVRTGRLAAVAWLAPCAAAEKDALATSGPEGATPAKERIPVTKRQITVQRLSISSKKPFQEVLSRIDSRIGHPDMAAFRAEITEAKTYQEVEAIVNKAVSSSGFMEFDRFDLGGILRKEEGGKAARIVRLIIGNPLIMKRMVEHVPDAGSYAPVTILVDESAGDVHLSYDTMASFLAPYRNAEALQVAQELDAKVEALLTAAAG